MADNENSEATVEVISDDDPNIEEAKDLSSQEDYEEMAPPKQEEEKIKKRYGGLLPKKPPLISNDKEHAFFDSADWALGKAGAQKSKGPLEALRPKLEPTPHQQTRSISAYASANDGEESVGSDVVTREENRHSPLDARVESRKNTKVSSISPPTISTHTESTSQPTPHQQTCSISAYASANDGEESVDSDAVTREENRQSQRKNATDDQNQQN